MLFDILHQELVETYIKNGTVYQTFIAYSYNGNAYITLYYIDGELYDIAVEILR